MIEQLTARPARILDHAKMKETGRREFRSTVLASTVMLYGSYRDLRTMLLCSGIDYADCPPKRWQQGLGIEPRIREETDTVWKNRLKAVAQGLFPDVKVTLWNADAILIAEYCRRVHAKTKETTSTV